MKIAALGDLHYHILSAGLHLEVFKKVCELADIMVLCGDLTDTGLPEEAEVLAKDLKNCTLPMVAVLGNHDYNSGQADKIREILAVQANVHMLEEEPFTLNEVGFAGVKGFGGGFDESMLGGFGEEATKAFVQEAVNEALKLENALRDLECPKKVVAFHYSPIKATVVGEPPEIYPFLGTSRLAEPLERFGATVAFHGHTHHGQAVGKTLNGVPVYNASMHVLKRVNPERPFLVIEI